CLCLEESLGWSLPAGPVPRSCLSICPPTYRCACLICEWFGAFLNLVFSSLSALGSSRACCLLLRLPEPILPISSGLAAVPGGLRRVITGFATRLWLPRLPCRCCSLPALVFSSAAFRTLLA